MTIDADDAAVRAYLRAVVGSPERAKDSVANTESGFVKAGARWAARSNVDRSTLEHLGVPRSVLDAAGVRQPPVADRIRPFYTAEPFNAATLARRACLSESAVRRALLRDELQGLVGRVLTPGRAVLWQGRRR